MKDRSVDLEGSKLVPAFDFVFHLYEVRSYSVDFQREAANAIS
jgi:hypothetical protein